MSTPVILAVCVAVATILFGYVGYRWIYPGLVQFWTEVGHADGESTTNKEE